MHGVRRNDTALLRRCLGVFPDAAYLFVRHWSRLFTTECWSESVRAMLVSPIRLLLHTIALGIMLGVLASLFGIARTSIGRPVEGPPPGWVEIESGFSVPSADLSPFSRREFALIRAEATTVEQVSAYRLRAGIFEVKGFTPSAADLEESAGVLRTRCAIAAAEISGDAADAFLTLIGGKQLTDEDTANEVPRDVLISEDLWNKRLAGRTDAIGMRIDLDGIERRIVGIARPRFPLGEPAIGVWTLLSVDAPTEARLARATGGSRGPAEPDHRARTARDGDEAGSVDHALGQTISRADGVDALRGPEDVRGLGPTSQSTNRDLVLLARLRDGATARAAQREVAALLRGDSGRTAGMQTGYVDINRSAHVNVKALGPALATSSLPVLSSKLSAALLFGLLMLASLARGAPWLGSVSGPRRLSRSLLTTALVSFAAVPASVVASPSLQVLAGKQSGSAMDAAVGGGIALLTLLVLVALMGPGIRVLSSRWFDRSLIRRLILACVFMACAIWLGLSQQSKESLRVLDRDDVLAIDVTVSAPSEVSEASLRRVVEEAALECNGVAMTVMSPGPSHGVAGSTIVQSSPASEGIDVGYRYVDRMYPCVMLPGTEAAPLGDDCVLINATLAAAMFSGENAIGRSIYGLATDCRPKFVAGVVPDFPVTGPLEKAIPEVLLGFDYARENELTPFRWTLLARLDRSRPEYATTVEQRLKSVCEREDRLAVTRVYSLQVAHEEASTLPNATARLAGLGLLFAATLSGLGIRRRGE